MINVLQYNPTSNSKIRAPQKQEMVAFKHQLEQTGLEAVSYTHLDVYKRQQHDIPQLRIDHAGSVWIILAGEER